MRKLLTMGVALMLLVAACGGGGDAGLSEDDQVLADAIAQEMLASSAATEGVGAEEAACFGNGIVSEMGAARLAAVGLGVDALAEGASPDTADLSADDIDKMSKVMVDCIDFRAVITEQMVASGVSEDGAKCIAAGFDDELIAEMAKASLEDPSGSSVTSDTVMAQVFSLMGECLSAEDLGNLGGG